VALLLASLVAGCGRRTETSPTHPTARASDNRSPRLGSDDAGSGAAAPIVDQRSFQEWCDSEERLPAGCPASSPRVPDRCANPGVRCAYPDSRGERLLLHECAPMGTGPEWHSRSFPCRHDCNEMAALPTVTVPGAVCETRPLVDCSVRADQTKQSVLDRQLDPLVIACGGWSWNYFVRFDKGCATSISGSPPECLIRELSKRRFECALDLGCALTSYDTRP
jgi:hypothetical protein